MRESKPPLNTPGRSGKSGRRLVNGRTAVKATKVALRRGHTATTALPVVAARKRNDK